METSMTEAPHIPPRAVPEPPVPPGVNPSRPSPARLYDYYLGGHNNLEVDRKAAEALRLSPPGAPNATLITADLRDPGGLLGHPAVRSMIDFSEPTGLLMTAVLRHRRPDVR